ncbi:uncharacterized protein LOC134474974 isoform X3 [Cavia porcellus]|uniref:uncharacterized protein LOC134474974 isoform X3 n=1 Tax=Cavia porcellus TaxID=10141 RepID=UPI002FE00CD4
MRQHLGTRVQLSRTIIASAGRALAAAQASGPSPSPSASATRPRDRKPRSRQPPYAGRGEGARPRKQARVHGERRKPERRPRPPSALPPRPGPFSALCTQAERGGERLASRTVAGTAAPAPLRFPSARPGGATVAVTAAYTLLEFIRCLD